MWLLYRKISHGDYNIGISYEKSREKGIYYVSTWTYVEITYNKDNGFSVGGEVFEKIVNLLQKK